MLMLRCHLEVESLHRSVRNGFRGDILQKLTKGSVDVKDTHILIKMNTHMQSDSSIGSWAS